MLTLDLMEARMIFQEVKKKKIFWHRLKIVQKRRGTGGIEVLVKYFLEFSLVNASLSRVPD